jgi:hypothetical protein
VAFPLPDDAGAVEEHGAMVLDAGRVVIRYG